MVLRYWWGLAKTAASIARGQVGIGHPKGWLVSALVWLLATALTYAVRGKPEDVIDGALIAFCGVVAVGLVFAVLVAIQLVILPPASDAAAKEKIDRLERIVNAPKPPLGPVVITLERFADMATEMVEHASIDDVDAFHRLRDTARDFLEERLSPQWIECFDREFSASTGRNIDPLYYFELLENWLHRCASHVTEGDLLPASPDVKTAALHQ